MDSQQLLQGGGGGLAQHNATMEQLSQQCGDLSLGPVADELRTFRSVWRHQLNQRQIIGGFGFNNYGESNMKDQVFLLTRRLLALESSADPTGNAKAAAAAKGEAETAAKECLAASKRATQAADVAAEAAAKEAAAAVALHVKTATDATQRAADETEAASQRATKSAAAAAETAAAEAAAAVKRHAKAATDAADAAATRSDAAMKRAVASAESSEATPLMAEIRGLRAARAELDAELAKLRAAEARITKIEGNCLVQNCTVQ